MRRMRRAAGLRLAVLAGDGQVTFGQTVVKQRARKIRRLYNDRILAGFAGSTADAFTLFSRFESKLEQYRGNLERSAVELAKDWRTDRYLRRLEAMMIVADRDVLEVSDRIHRGAFDLVVGDAFGHLAVPWHLLVESQYRGFLWYTVVDNHVLNALRLRQFPDEDVPLSSAEFLAVSGLGAFPWITPAALQMIALCRRCAWRPTISCRSSSISSSTQRTPAVISPSAPSAPPARSA